MDNVENTAVPAPDEVSTAPVEDTLQEEAATPTETVVAGCRSCGKPDIEGGYRFALCAGCRDTMARRPLPKWITATATLVGCILVIAFLLFSASLSAGIAFERGHRAEANHNYQEAMTQYKEVVRRFPNSTPALGRLCVAAFHAGQYDVAAGALDRLEGRETSAKLANEINPIVEQMEAIFKQAEKVGQLKLGDGTIIKLPPHSDSTKAQGGAKP